MHSKKPFSTIFKIHLALAIFGLGITSTAQAFVGFSFGSHTIDTVTPNAGNWTYQYTVFNDSRCIGNCNDTILGQPIVRPEIHSWDLPWFPLLGVDTNSIMSPAGWAYSIETIGASNPTTGWGGGAQWQNPIDANYQGPTNPVTLATQVLHWYDASSTNPIGELSSLAGFGFVALYGATYAPYQASANYGGGGTNIELFTADPAYPNSPYVFTNAVPEPSVTSLFGLGLGIIGFLAIRLRRRI